MSRHRRKNCEIHNGVAAAVATVLCFVSSSADARAIDDIRLSRIASETTIEIELGCAMRYVSHSPAEAGIEVQVQVSLGLDCGLALQGMRSDLRRPVGSRMGALSEVEFERGDREQATLTLRFGATATFEIRQTSNVYMLTVIAAPAMVARPPDPIATPPVEIPVEGPQSVPAVNDRRVTRQVRTPPSPVRNRFVIRAAVLSVSEQVDYATLEKFRANVVYTNEIAVGDRRWAELRIGFFDSEAEAEQALQRLGPGFPSAWITVANPEEQLRAEEWLLDWSSLQANDKIDAAVESVAVSRIIPTLSGDEIGAMMADARAALLRRDFARSIELYTRLLEEPVGEHSPDARELLGVAREKNGQPAYAKAEYAAYLDEFPDGSAASRVQQRLATLTLSTESSNRLPNQTGAASFDSDTQRWEYYGGASQYYLRGVNLSQDDNPDFVAQSALLSQAQLVARRHGRRFDIETRANLSYLYDFVENGSGDQGLVNYAYVDVNDTRTDVSLRLGRQRQQTGGALGRFDGATASYRLRPNLSVNVTTGFPVDSPRFRPTADHYFYGASIDLDNVAGTWDFSAFSNEQYIDGILDRRAVGAETQYHSHGLNVIGLLDYDASYNIVNTGLVTGNWRMNDRLTLYGQYRGGVAPFLTTRNAIIGQPVNTVRELFPSYTEGQIRRLARNRTVDERAGSAGLSAALTTRLQLTLDFSYLEYSATVASGGVAAYPGTGPQYTYGGHLLGSGFFKQGHVFIIGYRHSETQSVDGDTAWIDLRIPVGEKLRIQSRLAVSHRIANQNPAGDIEQWVADPTLRLLYTLKRRYRVELEVGGQWSSREFPAALAPPLLPDRTMESSDYYIQVGYGLDF